MQFVFIYAFNLTKPPFNNRLVRQAFAAAIDRNMVADLAATVGYVNTRPATTFIAPEILGRDLYGQVGWGYNVAKAQELFAKAGYPNGQGFPEVTQVTNVVDRADPRSPGNPKIADLLLGMWKDGLQVKMKVQVEGGGFQGYQTLLETNTPGLYRVSWAQGTSEPKDPSTIFPALFGIFRTGDARNYGRFTNTDYDRIVDQLKTTADPLQRQLLAIQAERILCEDEAMIIPLFYFNP